MKFLIAYAVFSTMAVAILIWILALANKIFKQIANESLFDILFGESKKR